MTSQIMTLGIPPKIILVLGYDSELEQTRR